MTVNYELKAVMINLHSRQNTVEGKDTREEMHGTTRKRDRQHDYNYEVVLLPTE